MKSNVVQIALMICLIQSFVSGAFAQQCALEQGMDIALYPAADQNVIVQDSERSVPVLIFGSADLDVADINLSSLELKVHPLWRVSQVELDERRPRCEFADLGAPAAAGETRIGPKDGLVDVLCQFDSKLALLTESIQPVKLTGTVTTDGAVNPIVGADYASGPDGMHQIYRCCITCDDAGNCSGCNSDTNCANDFARECEGSSICNDCTGCKEPRIC